MVARIPENADRCPSDELAPELRRAVEEVLGQSPPEDLMRRTLDDLRRPTPRAARPGRRRRTLIRALAVALCIAMLVLVGRHRNGGDGQNGPAPPGEIVRQPADTLPTLWAYHRASRDSPEALEELLDQHAGQLLVTESKAFSIGAFLDFDRESL